MCTALTSKALFLNLSFSEESLRAQTEKITLELRSLLQVTDTSKSAPKTLKGRLSAASHFFSSPVSAAKFPKKNLILISPSHIDKAWLFKSLMICESNTKLHGSYRRADYTSSSGIHLFRDNLGRNLSILKPCDEELGAIRSRNLTASMAKHGIFPGESAIREVLAHHIFPSIIPPTALVSLYLEDPFLGKHFHKEGSLQKFIPNCKTFRFLTREELATIDVQSFSKIAIIDLALANCDRNKGNLLIHNSTKKLIPIDHGCILSENFSSGGHFLWYNLISLSTNFTADDLKVIDAIGENLPLIFEKKLSLAAFETYRCSVILLKTLASTTSIKQIAMYHLNQINVSLEKFEMPEFSLLRSCLQIARFYQSKILESTRQPLSDFFIRKAVTELSSLIQNKFSEMEADLEKLGVSELLKNKILFPEDQKSPYISLAHLAARRFLNFEIRFENRVIFETGSWVKQLEEEINTFYEMQKQKHLKEIGF
jgi:hypothetical protein